MKLLNQTKRLLQVCIIALFCCSVFVRNACAASITNGAVLTNGYSLTSVGLSVTYSANDTDRASAQLTANDTIQVTATGWSLGWLGSGTNKTTLTFTNGNKKSMKLEYTLAISNGGSCTENEGINTVTIDAGKSHTIDVTSKSGNNTTTVTFSGIKLYSDSSSMTFYPMDSALGAYSVGGTKVESATAIDYTKDTVISLPTISGYEFVAWMKCDSNGNMTNTAYSTAASFAPGDDASIMPLYVPTGSAQYQVDGVAYYTWEHAMQAAKSGSGKVIVSGNGILPNLASRDLLGTYATNAGTTDAPQIVYQVPSGVKLLIPFSANDGGDFGSKPDNFLSQEDAHAILEANNNEITSLYYAYRNLVVATGAKIDCYGSINVNGQRQNDGQSFTGVTMGAYGKLTLGTENIGTPQTNESNIATQLIIRRGGSLYAYGYVTGTGMVEVEGSSGDQTGGVVHELLQMACWPGGTNAKDWNSNAGNSGDALFLLSEYHIQNIEAPMKLKYGATHNVEAVLHVSLLDNVTESVPFITIKDASTPGLFLLTDSNAYVLRIYDASADRMNYYLKGGTAEIGSLTITISGSDGLSINSANYILPVTHNMSLIADGATVTMDKKAALLPGAEVVVADDATINLSNQLFVFDVGDYTSSFFFNRAGFSSKNKSPNHCPVPYVATRNGLSPKASGIVVGVIDGKWSDTDSYYLDIINITDSAKLRVDGTLNMTGAGAICTTNGKSNTDKVITGTGVIKNNGTPVDVDLRVGKASLSTVNASYGLANIAGVGTLKPLASGTYYGQSNGYWYNYLVKAADADTAAKFTPGNTKLVDSTVSRYNGTETEEIPNVLGLVSNYLKDGVSTGSTFTFSVAPTTTPAATNGVFSLLSVAENSVGYGLSKVTADVTLSVSSVGTSTDITTVASNANYADIFTTETQLPDGIDVSGFFSDRECTSAASGIGGTLYTPTEAVAAIGPSKDNYAVAYMKISDAVNAADVVNSYVTVLQNRTLTDHITVSKGQNITIDLGKKTVTGNSKVIGVGKEPLTNYGTLRLVNGTMTYAGAPNAAQDSLTESSLTATVRNKGIIEFIEDLILKETYSTSVQVAALLNGVGGEIKEIRSGTFDSKSTTYGMAIVNYGKIGTIGTKGETVTSVSRRAIYNGKGGQITTIGGVGSTVTLTSGQRVVEVLSGSSVGTIGMDGSTVNLNTGEYQMHKAGIYCAGTITTIGGEGSTINITMTPKATASMESYGIYVSGTVTTLGAAGSVITINGMSAQTGDSADYQNHMYGIRNTGTINNIGSSALGDYSASKLTISVSHSGIDGNVYGIYSSKTITNLGAVGAEIDIMSSYTGTDESKHGYGIYNAGTITNFGTNGADIEVVSNQYGVYNASSKTINSISGDVVVVSTDTTGKYYGLCNQGTITTINSGDFYHENGRDNAVLNPDSQNYPTDRHGLSKDTRKVTLSDGTTTYDCYYVTVVAPAAGTVKGEDVIDQYVTLADAIEEYLALEDKTGVYVVLYDDCAETSGISLDKDIYLDLNGHTVTLAEDGLTVGNNVTLYGMDSKTNAYLTDGSRPGQIVGTISGKIDAVHSIEDGANAGKHYAVVTKTVDGKNVTQFHRVGVSVSAYRFFVSSTDMTGGYLSVEGTFRSTRDGFDAMDKLGFVGVSETIARDALVESVAEDGTVTLWKDSYVKGDRIPIHYTFATGLNTENKIGMVAMYDSDSAESAMRTLVLKEVLEDYCSALNAEEDADLIAKINSYLGT